MLDKDVYFDSKNIFCKKDLLNYDFYKMVDQLNQMIRVLPCRTSKSQYFLNVVILKCKNYLVAPKNNDI